MYLMSIHLKSAILPEVSALSVYPHTSVISHLDFSGFIGKETSRKFAELWALKMLRLLWKWANIAPFRWPQKWNCTAHKRIWILSISGVNPSGVKIVLIGIEWPACILRVKLNWVLVGQKKHNSKSTYSSYYHTNFIEMLHTLTSMDVPYRMLRA